MRFLMMLALMVTLMAAQTWGDDLFGSAQRWVLVWEPGIPVETRERELAVLRFQSLTERTSAPIQVYWSETPLSTYAMRSFSNSNMWIHTMEPDWVYEASKIPNDPYFGEQWGVLNQHPLGKEGQDSHATEAWDDLTESNDVVIAVIDTGVDYHHPDMAANLWENSDEVPGNGIDDDNNGYIDDVLGWDFVNQDPDPMDDNMPVYHGTHVSGVLGAVGNNHTGISGVNWSTNVMALKGLSQHGRGYVSELSQAIIYAVDNGADIINASWGGSRSSTVMRYAIDYAEKKGVLVVAAAGNSGQLLTDKNMSYPAGYDSEAVVAVGASDPQDQLAVFSNYGMDVDLAAPGVDILSLSVDEGYQRLSGTSMAAPFVAGVSGLLKQKNNAIQAPRLKEALLEGVDQIARLDQQVKSGGRLNAAQSLALIPEAINFQDKQTVMSYYYRYRYHKRR